MWRDSKCTPLLLVGSATDDTDKQMKFIVQFKYPLQNTVVWSVIIEKVST